MEIEVTNGTWNIKHASSDDVITLGNMLSGVKVKSGFRDAMPTVAQGDEFNMPISKAPSKTFEFHKTVEIQMDDVWDRKKQGLSFAQACRVMIKALNQVSVERAQKYFKDEYDFKASRDKVRKALNELRRDGEIGATGVPGQQGSTYHVRGRKLEQMV